MTSNLHRAFSGSGTGNGSGRNRNVSFKVFNSRHLRWLAAFAAFAGAFVLFRLLAGLLLSPAGAKARAR